MMIKVSNEFLDFNELIEMEKQIKLFEDISTTDGDFSYAFELPKTLHNTKLLGNPFPDNINKPVYQQIPAKILGDSGAELYDGYLRVERVTSVYSCSFFAGNNNWFAMITGLLSDLDLSRFDIEQTRTNIVDSWPNTEGLVFPLLDNGALLTRSFPQVKIEDFIGGFYVKTIFNQIFVEAGIKIKGELLNDWMFQNIVCLKNSKSQDEINTRTSYVEKTSVQTGAALVPLKMTFDNDSLFPYFDGSADNYDLPNSRYIADIKMTVQVQSTLVTDGSPTTAIHFYVNGIDVARTVMSGDTVSLTKILPLNAGDVLEVYGTIVTLGFPFDFISGNVRITPIFLYKTFGKAAVPNWTKQQFVSNILRIFNVLASYEEGNATLTLNLLEKIKSKPAVDLSEYVSETEVDYSEFISDYGQRSTFSYNQVDTPELRDYNVGKYFKYSQGVIEVDNDFLEPDQDIIKSDFSNPIAYIHGVFKMSMERANLIEVDEDESQDITSVSDASGNARFNIAQDIFLVGDLVRIKDSTNVVYNGDWVVSAVATGWIELLGTAYDTDATASVTKLVYVYANSDDVFLFVNIPNYEVSKFSDNEFFYLEANGESSFAVAYFDLINTGRQINLDFIYSLSFGGIDDPLHYQVTLIDQYFRLFSRVLNDPVKLFCTAHLPYAIFVGIDFLSPITIKTLETTNQYYLNRMSGYKESYYPTVLQLIKLP